MNKEDNNINLIREFFSVLNKPVTIQEIKALTSEDRVELGEAIRATLS